MEWRSGSRTPHRLRGERSRLLEKGSSGPPADGVTGVSLVRGRPTRRVTNRCGLSKGEAMPAGRPGGGGSSLLPPLDAH